MRRFRRRGDEGAAALEFALVVPVFLVFVGGMLALGLRMAYSGIAEHAAREGLRTATVKTTAGGYASQNDVQNKVDSVFSGLLNTVDPVTVAVNQAGPIKRQGDEVRVTVHYRIGAVSAAARIMPFGLGRGALENLADVTTTAEGRLE